MINIESKYLEAKCDICSKDLIDPSEPDSGANFGVLESRFGWPSRLDILSTGGSPIDYPNKVVCEDCWEKALKVLGLDATQFSERSV